MISQPMGAQMNKHLLLPLSWFTKRRHGDITVFPHGFRNTWYSSPFSTEVLGAIETQEHTWSLP